MAGEGSLRRVRSRALSESLRQRHRELGTTDPRVLDAMETVAVLTRLEARLSQDFERSVHRPLGITWAGFRILNVLWAFGGTPQHELTRLSGTSRASVSSALTTLERQELVARRVADNDRRQLVVELLPAGLSILERAVAIQADRLTAWTDVLRDDQLGELLHLLNTLVGQDVPSRAASGRQGARSESSSE
ncbi:MarR family transcriptional regulator [Nocardia sp. R7R-8]|uniref:MarR family transcriptional regulator n=1 Tax=Nocardia sp. R7R-8 TaxID=3459304 RepID=UPI00403DA53E